jgi:hypothetical protein
MMSTNENKVHTVVFTPDDKGEDEGERNKETSIKIAQTNAGSMRMELRLNLVSSVVFVMHTLP